MIYYISWTYGGANYTRTFDSAEERSNFKNNWIPTRSQWVKTWEYQPKEV